MNVFIFGRAIEVRVSFSHDLKTNISSWSQTCSCSCYRNWLRQYFSSLASYILKYEITESTWDIQNIYRNLIPLGWLWGDNLKYNGILKRIGPILWNLCGSIWGVIPPPSCWMLKVLAFGHIIIHYLIQIHLLASDTYFHILCSNIFVALHLWSSQHWIFSCCQNKISHVTWSQTYQISFMQ